MAENSRSRIVEAALRTLKERGFAGTSTRAIAASGGFRAGLIFYYFPSLHELLLAALEQANRERLERYACDVAAASSLTELLTLLERIHRDDLDSGYIQIVAEMVAGSVAHPELGPRVVALMEPWINAAQAASERVLAPTGLGAMISPRQLAFASVTFYLGANLMSRLVPDSREVEEILQTARRLAPMIDMLAGGLGGAGAGG